MVVCSDFYFPREVQYLFDIVGCGNDKLRIVGGCVRNFLLGQELSDYDLCTKYKPDELIDILKKNNVKYIDTSAKYGTVIAIVNNKPFEITTLRKDINTRGRDTDVEFVDSYEEDAQRRDFTFNAIYIDENKNLYDYCNGISDLNKSIVKFIGDPYERIKEDNLRILRFFRFSAYYGFVFDNTSLKACIECKDLIKNLSIERITNEFVKILMNNFPLKVLHTMEKYNILQYIVDVEGKIDYNKLAVFYSIRKFLNFQHDFSFVLSLINSTSKIKKINLLLSNKQNKNISNIEKYKITYFSIEKVKKLLFCTGDKDLVKHVLMIYFCNNFSTFEEVKYTFDFVDNYAIPKLPITGQDLIENNFTDRSKYSIILEYAKDMFINSDYLISKSDILQRLKKLAN